MEQYTDSQYDDDLTIGTDEYDDSDVDLFEFGGDEDSAISRLKTLVLSIDWEITDEVLIQFNDEILDLKDVWAGEKIEMVYLQALEKIGKYIYRDKADAHPNAMRLLLSLYYNLEKIVLSSELSGAEKKKILLEDVRRFEKLKTLISKKPKVEKVVSAPEPVEPELDDQDDEVDVLRDLKAIVLGIDWEITDEDLIALREEVQRLEELFSENKPKMVLLQGIGTIGAYIRKKKSDSHADAFKLLHSFYEALEKLFRTPGMTLEQEKDILRPEVQKFNAFKVIIADTLSVKDDDSADFEDDDSTDLSSSGPIAPAFADLPEEGTHGFLEEVEAERLLTDSPVNVDEHINKFFGDDELENSVSSGDGEGELDAVVEQPVAVSGLEKEAEELSAAFFSDEFTDEESVDANTVDRELALQGVDVETEADDDSDEEALPVLGGEIAPALLDSADVSVFNEAELKEELPTGELTEELTGRLDDFFGVDEEEQVEKVAPPELAIPADVALQGVDVEVEGDADDEVATADAAVAKISDEVAPAFIEIDDNLPEPAALFGEEGSKELELDGSEMAEEAVGERFDELFGAMSEQAGEAELKEVDTVDETSGFEVPAEVALQGVNVEAEGDEDDEDDDPVVTQEGVVALDSDAIVPAFNDITEEVVEPAGSLVSGSNKDVELAEEVVEQKLDEMFGAISDDDGELDLAEADVEEDIDGFFNLEEDSEVDPSPESVEEVQEFLDIDESDIQTIDQETEFADSVLSGDDSVEMSREQLDDEVSDLASGALVMGALVAGAVTDDDSALSKEVPVVSLDALQGCIKSIDLELNDAVIQGLFSEINSLRQQWTEYPAEKSFLQLMSTVTQHIGQYRYNANDESNVLLASIMEGLESSQGMDSVEKQESLLTYTFKVLQWQQSLVDSHAVRDGDGYLTFAAPTPTPVDSPFDETMVEKESSEDIQAALPDEKASFDVDLEEALSREIEGETEKTITLSADDPEFPDVVRREIDTLRDTLKREIAELRKSMNI